jgi:hypothetical protein
MLQTAQSEHNKGEYIPNPYAGGVTIESSETMKELFVTDFAGKI